MYIILCGSDLSMSVCGIQLQTLGEYACCKWGIL